MSTSFAVGHGFPGRGITASFMSVSEEGSTVKIYYPLAYPPVDDDYLEEEEQDRNRNSYDYSAIWAEDEAVEAYFGGEE